jgi:hypothetical protein
MTVNQDEVFDKAADMFAVMSTPIRLRIIRRRSVVFRMTDDAAVEACQAVCTQVAIGLDVNDQTNKEFV